MLLCLSNFNSPSTEQPFGQFILPSNEIPTTEDPLSSKGIVQKQEHEKNPAQQFAHATISCKIEALQHWMCVRVYAP